MKTLDIQYRQAQTVNIDLGMPDIAHFRVLRGAMNLLKEPYQMMFHTVFHPAGMEEI